VISDEICQSEILTGFEDIRNLLECNILSSVILNFVLIHSMMCDNYSIMGKPSTLYSPLFILYKHFETIHRVY
jgi:hypothetical protein